MKVGGVSRLPHDLRLVWPPRVQGLAAVAGGAGVLGIACFEYCLAVPANRHGHGAWSAAELTTMQDVITLVVFTVFSVVRLKEAVTWNHAIGFACIAAGAFFVFRGPL